MNRLSSAALYALLTASLMTTAACVGELEESSPDSLEPVDTVSEELVYSYSASNTNSATVNTVNYNVLLYTGETITIGTCGLPGATSNGDTYLRFRNPANVEVASNDDACGGVGSKFTYKVPATGTYQLRAGCYGNDACSGAWGYSITAPAAAGSLGGAVERLGLDLGQ
jgi:hypothetical protein